VKRREFIAGLGGAAAGWEVNEIYEKSFSGEVYANRR
jgi:hypothetical protein